MRKLLTLWLLALGLAAAAWAGAPDAETPAPAALPLTATALSFAIDRDEDEGDLLITTLGRLRNDSPRYYNNITVEVQYFDAQGQLIDAVNERLYGVIAPAGQDITFRVTHSPARPKALYATQTLRVVTADVCTPRTAGSTAKSGGGKSLWEHAVAFVPMMAFLAVLIVAYAVAYRKTYGKNSPQAKSMAVLDEQAAIARENAARIDRQNELFERIAVALERAVSGRAVP